MREQAATAAEREAALERMFAMTVGFQGTLTFPCLPAATDIIVLRIVAAVNGVGRGVATETIEALRASIRKKTQQGYAQSPHHRLIVKYGSDAADPKLVNFETSVFATEAYAAWGVRAGQSQFGERPDAMAVALVTELGAMGLKVLDVGAGTGRNAMALAKLGCAVDAVELNPEFAKLAAKAGVPHGLNFITGDFLDVELALRRAPYDLVLLAEVISSHAPDVAVLRHFFTRMRAVLRPGGLALCSLFVADDEEVLSDLARQVGNHYLSCPFSARDLAQALAETGFTLLQDQPVAAVERAEAAPGTWPPTEWFEDWAAGRNVFALPHDVPSPLELKWLTFVAS